MKFCKEFLNYRTDWLEVYGKFICDRARPRFYGCFECSEGHGVDISGHCNSGFQNGFCDMLVLAQGFWASIKGRGHAAAGPCWCSLCHATAWG